MTRLTEQIILDRVVEHASKQLTRATRPHIDGSPLCEYRSASGAKCFVGALIPDELYKSEMERHMCSVLIDEFDTIKELFSGVSTGFLYGLQVVHDDWSQNEDIVPALRRLADAHNLKFPSGYVSIIHK